MFVSSPCFVLHALYSVMQVKNENVYPEQSVVLLARYRKLVLRVKFLGTKDFVPQLQQYSTILSCITASVHPQNSFQPWCIIESCIELT